MSLIRRSSPWGELMSLRQAMDRLFEESFVRPRGWVSAVFESNPLPLDVRTTPDALVVEAQLPGVRPEDVEITVEAGTLTISGAFKTEEAETEGDYLIQEIRRGVFSRSISLPEGLEPDQATATFENGILTLRIPKAEQVKPRQIRITAVGQKSDGGASSTGPATAGRS